MPYFYLNTRPRRNGDHEVHEKEAGCGHEPEAINRMDLGWHSGCRRALAEANKTYPQSNGCFYCCNPCHTS